MKRIAFAIAASGSEPSPEDNCRATAEQTGKINR
jgi:hypothetical protein